MDVNESHNSPAGKPVRPPWVWIAGSAAIAGLIGGPACSNSEQKTAEPKQATASSGHGTDDKMGTESSGHGMDDKMGTEAESTKVGESASRMSVVTLSGSTFVVPTGKPTALWFTADGCRSCIPKAQALDKIKSGAGDRIAVLGVDINPADTEAVFRRWIGEVGEPHFDFAMDKNGQLAVAWGVRDTSTVIILDGAGTIVYHSTGAADEATFRSAFAKAGLA